MAIEPTNGAAPRPLTLDQIRRYQRQIIMPEVGSIADYSYLLADGRAVAQGTTAELNASTDPAVRQFMEGAPDGPVPFHYPAPAYPDELLQEAAS